MMRHVAKLDPRLFLRHAYIYNLHSKIVGPSARKQLFVDRILRPARGERVLDIGCGTAPLLGYMPPVSYVGFDQSAEYIAKARATYGEKAEFQQRVLTEEVAEGIPPFDLAMAIGVIHHLDDDEARMLFRVARRALRPGGRLVTCDGAYVAGQGLAARLLLDMDRGQHVRSPQAYQELAASTFSKIEASVHHDLNAFPYTHFVMTCHRTE